jgi:hypothetical protein
LEGRFAGVFASEGEGKPRLVIKQATKALNVITEKRFFQFRFWMTGINSLRERRKLAEFRPSRKSRDQTLSASDDANGRGIHGFI